MTPTFWFCEKNSGNRFDHCHFTIFFSGIALFSFFFRQRHGTSVELYPTKKISSKSGHTSNFATGPSPFVGKDLFAEAKAAISAQAPQQVPQTPQVPGMPNANQSMFANKPNQTNPFGGGNSQSTSIFGNQSTLGQPNQGLLGQTMSPFGGTTAQSSPFQTGGKRGKH